MRKLLLLLFLLQSTFAFASPELKRLFQNSFLTHYEASKCGPNILGLLERADKKNIELYNANILEITNVGYSMFGLVNAEFVRAAGRSNPDYPASGLSYLPGEKNWYHHVVLEKDGFIYDFDFGNSPKVVTIKEYFDKMFLNDKRESEGGEFYIGREEKLKTYQIVVIPGLETLEARRRREKSPEGEKMRLGVYLNSVR